MTILYADEFRKLFKKLPFDVQSIYYGQESIFKNNWRDSKLHLKKLVNHQFSFSFRVTRNYRVLFSFIHKDTVLFATIGHRKNIYK